MGGDISNYNFRGRGFGRSSFHLANFYPPCEVCKRGGTIVFMYDGRTYPNAPCPVCRYQKLMAWCNHWGLGIHIAQWLRQRYLTESNKYIRGPKGIHRRRQLFQQHIRDAVGAPSRDQTNGHLPAQLTPTK